MIVQLTEEEIAAAKARASRRHAQTIGLGGKDILGFGGVAAHELGHLGEVAFARASGREVQWYEGPDRGPDVGPWHVRTVTKRHHRLVIRQNDVDYMTEVGEPQRYVLVLQVTEASYEILGTIILGPSDLQDSWKHDPGGHGEAWFVPTRELNGARR